MAKRISDKIAINYININDLHSFEGNPRKIDDAEMKKLRRSLREYGFVDPCIVRKETNQIIGGHQRVEAAKLEGTKTIPVVYLEGLSDEKAKLLNIALNKISGEWDWPKLGDLFGELDTGDIDLTLSGFELSDIEGLMNGLDEVKKEVESQQEDFDYMTFAVTLEQRQEIEQSLDEYEADNRTEQLLCAIRK